MSQTLQSQASQNQAFKKNNKNTKKKKDPRDLVKMHILVQQNKLESIISNIFPCNAMSLLPEPL